MVRRTCGSLAALGMTLLALAACDLGSSTIPRPDPLVVVHAVLNPSLSEQVILLEESLTGKAPPEPDFVGVVGTPILVDPLTPSLNGTVPITGATVQLEDETGTVYIASDHDRPAGVYVVPITVKPGMRYTLTVNALGKTVTASTVVPRATLASAAAEVPFNRTRDTAKVSIPDVEFARGYFLRVDAPISSFSMVTTDREIAITGDTRNLFTENLLRVFMPGFEQKLTVAAVDTNLYDYYRSGNDPFSGVGLIEHVQGGLGVFGSIAVIERRVLDVTQDVSGHPLEATFTRRVSAPDSVPRAIHFYLESSAQTLESQDRISGYYIAGPASNPVKGPFLVTITFGGSFDVQMFKPGTTIEAAELFTAYATGDSEYIPNRYVYQDTVKAYFEGVPGAMIYVRQGVGTGEQGPATTDWSARRPRR